MCMILRNQARDHFTNKGIEVQNGLVIVHTRRFVAELILDFRPSEFKPVHLLSLYACAFVDIYLHLFDCVFCVLFCLVMQCMKLLF